MVGKMMLWVAFSAEVYGAMYELRWMIAFAATLILVDLYWGSREAVSVRCEEWHFSRAGRRTLNKVVEYLTYLLVGCVGGMAILEPVGVCSHLVSAAVGLGFGSMFEISSIIGHVLAVHGIKKKFNVWTFMQSVLSPKRRDISDSIYKAIEDDNE